VWRTFRLTGLAAVLAFLSCGATLAEDTSRQKTVFELTLPGGLEAALAAIDDRVPADRSQFLLEFIRRTYHEPAGANDAERERALASLLAYLDRPGPGVDDPRTTRDTLPLPLPPRVWIDVVFGGRASPEHLLSSILRSRNAALFYYGLLWLDDDTRAWLATQPALVAELSGRHAAVFSVAAPALRIDGSVVRVPGGAAAEPIWQALVGQPSTEPAAFVRALLAAPKGRLAYFYGALGQLTPAQLTLALSLDAADAPARISAARRLQKVFETVAGVWEIEERTFWRPARDPALLAADLRLDEHGRPMLPGTQRFWRAVFERRDRDRAPPDDDLGRALLTGSDRVEFAWLCEHVFRKNRSDQASRYRQVLFASRMIPEVSAGTVRDAADALHGVGRYPALAGTLERAGVSDLDVFAEAVRRSAQLSAIPNARRAARATAQFQGILALVTRAALRGSLPRSALSSHVSSLAAVPLGGDGTYEGRLVSWLHAQVAGPGSRATFGSDARDTEHELDGRLDAALIALAAGGHEGEPRVVSWEGTRYLVDLPRAEALRLSRFLGDDVPPYASAARLLVLLADALERPGPADPQPQRAAAAFGRVAREVGWEGGGSWNDGSTRDAYRRAAGAWQQLSRGERPDRSRLARDLRELADDLLARRLTELVYAAALGQPEQALVSVAELASRHDFGLPLSGPRRGGAWAMPSARTHSAGGWRVTGSLLGLDVRLADLSLLRLTWKPLPSAPTLLNADRRVLIEAVALMEPVALRDADRNAIVSAIREGRARLTAIRTPAEAVAIAEEIHLGAARRTLLPWVVRHDPERLAAFLSPAELLWLGLGKAQIDPQFHAWGAPAEPRIGCVCLRLPEPRPWETQAGRWRSGKLASVFPDLNLRLAELLGDLQMPASLLGHVLAAATLDFADSVVTRDEDDRRGLVEFVLALRQEKVEQYLALLTTDGPLVPLDGPAGVDGSNTGITR
jgi:hypothetical protein